MARPNLLLISLDSVRRDLVSCYGGGSPHAPGVPTSPELDALAAEGTRMDRAFSTTSWTLPSHLALFTGSPELVHGVTQNYSVSTGSTTSYTVSGEQPDGKPMLTAL